MGKHRLAFVAFDSAKDKHAVAIADDGRDGEVRYLGEIDNSPDAVRKLVAKLSRQYQLLHFCYEAGPTGYGLHRQLTELGHLCDVIAPTMIPKRSGDRVKTNRRDSVTLVKLLRAGELRAIWVPDSVHEAVRDLTRARETAIVSLIRLACRHSLEGEEKTHFQDDAIHWDEMLARSPSTRSVAVRATATDQRLTRGPSLHDGKRHLDIKLAWARQPARDGGRGDQVSSIGSGLASVC